MANMADEMKNISKKAIAKIQEDSIKFFAPRFLQNVLYPKMHCIARRGGTSITIPKDLTQSYVGNVVEDPIIGTYLEYDFDNNGEKQIVLYRDIQRVLLQDGFSVQWNAVNTPYLEARWE
jgi:hypothetical protein